MRVALTDIAYGALTLVAAGAVGCFFNAIGVPLGWLIGAMLVMITASVLDLPAVQPTPVIPYVKASVGTLLGASVTLEVIRAIPEWWISLTAMLAVMVCVGTANFHILRRALGFSPTDAALCSMPGGITEMILLGEQTGADQRRVAIVHALRIALSILTIPPIVAFVYGIEIDRAGAQAVGPMSTADWGWFGLCILSGLTADRWVQMPAPLILVPLVLCAGLHVFGVTEFAVPGAVSQAMQIVIGLNVGARFQNVSPAALARVAGAAVLVVATQIGMAVCAALAVSGVTGFDQLALMLAFAPGGLAEMSLIAIAMGRDVAFVGLHHILRVLLSLGLAPLLLQLLRRRT